eukprot:1815825-Rhodomonas_salina.4
MVLIEGTLRILLQTFLPYLQRSAPPLSCVSPLSGSGQSGTPLLTPPSQTPATPVGRSHSIDSQQVTQPQTRLKRACLGGWEFVPTPRPRQLGEQRGLGGWRPWIAEIYGGVTHRNAATSRFYAKETPPCFLCPPRRNGEVFGCLWLPRCCLFRISRELRAGWLVDRHRSGINSMVMTRRGDYLYSAGRCEIKGFACSVATEGCGTVF